MTRRTAVGPTSRHNGSRLAPNLHICIQSVKWIQPSINNDSLSEAEGWERPHRRQKYPTGITVLSALCAALLCGIRDELQLQYCVGLHVLQNNDTSRLKFSWHLSLANFHMKQELDKWSPRYGTSVGPWNKHRTWSRFLPKRYIIIYNDLRSCGLDFS